MSRLSLSQRALAFFTLSLLCCGLVGCGKSNDFSVTKITGVVLCEGQPIANVKVSFFPVEVDKNQPIVGKSGQGQTQADGTFSISTYKPGDGAVLGKHDVRVAALKKTAPDCPADLSATGTVTTVDVVKGGENHFTINVPKRDPRKKLELPEE